MHLALEGGREGSFIYLLSLNNILEYLTDLRKQMVCSQFLPPPPNQRPCPGSVRQHQNQASHLLKESASEHLLWCRFSLIDILALETRSWLLSHFRISFWELEHLSLIACHSASGPGWQARLLWLMMWLMDKIRKNIPKTFLSGLVCQQAFIKVAAEGIFCHASLHSNGIPRQSCFFSWHKTAGSFMGAGPTEPGGRSSTKSGHFQSASSYFLLSWIQYESTQYEMGMRDFSD